MKHFNKQIAIVVFLALILSLYGCSEKTSSEAISSTVAPASSFSAPPIQKFNFNHLTGEELSTDFVAGSRPVAVMVGNNGASLPQSGLSLADVLFETVTEAGITRIMALYLDYQTLPKVGPVRSTRDQFIELAMPMNSILAHIGNSIYGKDVLNYYGYQDIDGIYIGTAAYYFDTERAKSKSAEFCWYTNAELLKSGMEAEKLEPIGGYFPIFNFVEKGEKLTAPPDGEAANISFSFSPVADGSFSYDSTNGVYLKSQYGVPQIDVATGTQLSFKNIFILGTAISPRPDGLCTDFELTQGLGIYCYGANKQFVRWSKGNPENPLRIFDSEGNELKVNAGKSYVAFIEPEKINGISFS